MWYIQKITNNNARMRLYNRSYGHTSEQFVRRLSERNEAKYKNIFHDFVVAQYARRCASNQLTTYTPHHSIFCADLMKFYYYLNRIQRGSSRSVGNWRLDQHQQQQQQQRHYQILNRFLLCNFEQYSVFNVMCTSRCNLCFIVLSNTISSKVQS